MNFLKAFLSASFILFFINCNAQEFGGNPASTKWKQIDNKVSRIIFPAGMDSTANRISNIISYLDTSSKTLGDRHKKINLVLQTNTTISNAYVSLSPFRSEFFLTPDQNSFELGSLPWPDQLAIHEFRHVQQYNNFNVGIAKALRVVFGDNGQALANNAAIPNWFFEGDAVYNETNVSAQGRGRIPLFFEPFRALWAANKNYSWMKLRNGSYVDFIPDHYPLGYMMVAYGREKYGDLFWEKVTQDAARFKGLFFPFQKAIEKHSGLTYQKFTEAAFNYFKDQFKDEKQNVSKDYYSEDNPVVYGNGIIYIRSSYKQVPQFVIRENGKDRVIRTRDLSLNNYFSAKNGKIAYASLRPNIRWGYSDYSDIKILDVATGKQTDLSNHSKYFSPNINNEGDVVVVEVIPGTSSHLVMLNGKDGSKTTIPNPDNLFYTYPKFFGKDIICPVRNANGEMSIARIDPVTGASEYLLPFSLNVYGGPSIKNDTLLFSGSHGNKNELFAFIISKKQLFHLIPGREGVGYYSPKLFNGKIIYRTFTAAGNRIILDDTVTWKLMLSKDIVQKLSSYGVSSLNKTNAGDLYRVPDNATTSTNYSGVTGLLHFHSAQPDIDDPEYTFSLLSENILNTMQAQVSFTYNRAEQWKRIGAEATYGGWYPFITGGMHYTFDRTGIYHGKRIFWNEMEPFIGFNIPLNLSKGRSLTSFNFGSRFTYNESDFKGVYKDSIGRISFSYLNNFISLVHQGLKAKQQIYPHFAQSLSLNYKTALTHYEGSQFVANANIYLPGLLTNHSLVINGGLLMKDSSRQINFSSDFPFSRGYNAVNLFRMYKVGATYHLPLFYPDAGFGNIVYFLRVRGNVFYDHTYTSDFFTNRTKFNATFRSLGSEIYFDTKWWNQALITFGFRYSHLLDPDLFGGTGSDRFEVILPVNIFNN